MFQVLLCGVSCIASLASPSARGDDPLPSWNDTGSKRAIIGFVERVTSHDSPDYVPPLARIAVFDNDGTLWPENPMPFQLAYALDELKLRVGRESDLAEDPFVQAALAGNVAKLIEGPHHEGLLRIIAMTHAGMTTDAFTASVEAWITTARHPRFDLTYGQLAYQPMLELLAFLRAKEFQTFIVSGGGADFMRAWSPRVYGIPPHRVIGSTARTRFQMREGNAVLIKTTEHLFVDDKEGKPVGIHQFIGQRPIACFGNSDGDQAMLEYTTIGNPLPSFGLIVHHTDAEREYAYDTHPKSSGGLVTALEAASQRGWVVVDMARDWNRIWREE